MNNILGITASRRPRSRQPRRTRCLGHAAVAGGEHGGQIRDPDPASTRAVRSPTGTGLSGELRAEARRSDRHRGARRDPAGVVQFGEVGGQGHVVELAPVKLGVEPPLFCSQGRVLFTETFPTRPSAKM